jgi:catechol 2,3-dioxygenase-like lactoylglutathione lyase family enzyme
MADIEIDYGKPPERGWLPIVCELYVKDISRSLAFWCGAIGFEIAYQRPEESFAYLERSNGAQVMLYQSPSNQSLEENSGLVPHSLLQIYVEDLSPVLVSLKKKNWPIQSGPKEVWRRWGDRLGGKREIRLQDPDGHALLIAEDIGEKVL